MSDRDCPMALLTQADFDGELDVAHAAELAQHRAGCAQCQAAYAALAGVRTVLREADLYETAPEALRRFVMAQRTPHSAAAAVSPPQDRPWRSWFRWPALNFGLGAAMATAVALLVLWSGPSDMADQVVDDHIRALQPGHLEDVVSTDRHTVKPWFEGKLDYAPPVKDLAAQQFPLIGGRLDALGGRPIAAMIYKRGTHPIDLLVWPAREAGTRSPVTSEHNGFTVIHWTQDGMDLWAVSDVERAQLEEFVRLWQTAP